MGVRKTDDGKSWMYDERHPVTKKRKRVGGFRSKGEADQARSIALAKWRGEKHGIKADAPKVSLRLRDQLEIEAALLREEAVDFFHQTERGVSNLLLRFIPLIPENLKVTDLNEGHLSAIIKNELDRGLPSRSVKTYMARFRGALNRVKMRNGELLEDWRIPNVNVSAKASDKLRRFWTPDEVEKILAVLGNPSRENITNWRYKNVADNWRDTYDFIAIGALTGMRKSEILLLEWGKIFLHWNTMQARSLKKRKAVYRDIPISPQLRAILEDRRVRVTEKYGEDARLVFPRWEVNNHSGWIYESLRQACEVAGIQYGDKEFGLVPHGLRHGAATFMLTNGVDITTAAEILGNTVTTMLTTYAHTTMESKRKAVGSLQLGELGRRRSA